MCLAWLLDDLYLFLHLLKGKVVDEHDDQNPFFPADDGNRSVLMRSWLKGTNDLYDDFSSARRGGGDGGNIWVDISANAQKNAKVDERPDDQQQAVSHDTVV